MDMLKPTLLLILSLGFMPLARAQTPPEEITLSLRVRDPKTGQVVIQPLKIDPRKGGIVIVDPWNYHWCMTWTEQAGGMTPRMNRALQGCRWTLPWGNCLCGPGLACVVNYGWDGMDPRLEIVESDLIVSGTQELYSLCQARGITLLIYFGGATNICLTGKDVGLGPMYAAGLETAFARDLAFAWTQ
jgi:hypothetical protein